MEKILVSLPDDLATRLRTSIPSRQRSKLISELLEKELARRERALYECALALEQDETLNQEMEEWETTSGDGINDEAW